uniref:Beta-2-glycoprotein 1 n=1 Tax=Esox lucius TaxID=8010 RepID=A0A3P8YC49_ESOLU
MAPTLALLLLCQLALYTAVTSKRECGRPLLRDGMDINELQRVYSPGDMVVLSCRKGYTPTSGARTIVCSANGEWTQSRLKCLRGSSTTYFICFDKYSNVIAYRYTLQGASTIECLADGEWTEPPPKCLPLTCGLPPIPAYGKIVYDSLFYGNTVVFGFGVSYQCLPPLALIGNERGMCSANGKWTEPPECKLVTCPPPKNISNGYITTIVKREYGYMDTVRYGCNVNYVLDGPVEVECQKTGDWSQNPACRAPCTNELPKGYYMRNHWPSKTLHEEVITFRCINMEKMCGYAVSTQCIDGKVKFPKCLEETNVRAHAYQTRWYTTVSHCQHTTHRRPNQLPK